VGEWTGPIGFAPALADPQLLESSALEPLVASGNRMLVGARRGAGTGLTVLADPDLVENHGLHRGDNAQLAVALVERVRRGPGPIVFDDSFLPQPTRPSPWRALLAPPLIFATVQALLTALLVVWTALGRFGPAAPVPPPLPAGKVALVESTAALLRAGGHTRAALDRYLSAALQDVGARLHAPPGLRRAELLAWLDGVAPAAAGSATALWREIQDTKVDVRRGLLPLARKVHGWRVRMLHGSR
jgi:hypothetical protein